MGYKRTDLGLMPENWDVKTMDSLTSLMTNGFVGTATNAYVNNDDGVIYIQGYNVEENGFNFRGIKRVSDKFHKKNTKSALKEGDLLTIQTGDIGVTTIVPIELVGANCHALIISRFNKNSADPKFYSQYFNFSKGRSQLKEIETGSTMKHLNVGDMKYLSVPFPPLSEQKTIATALSDIDRLLAGLSKLITKKRDIKQAAMQQLLTGETRLPGFGGKWIEKKLGDTAELKARIGWQGLTTAEYLSIGEYYLVTGTEFCNGYIDWRSCHFVEETRYKQDKYIQLKIHDVLVTKDGTIGKVALVSELPLPATLNSGVFVIRPIEHAFYPEFFYYLLCSRVFTKFLDQLSAGSTINHLYQKDFVGFKYKVPESIVEQTAIAKVLSDMDNEIAALEKRLKKTRLIKQGMMQELLTGRIRLV